MFECKVCVHLYKCRSHNGVKYFPMSQWNRVFILIDFKKRVNFCCFSSIASTLQRFALCSPVQLSSHMQMYVRIERQMLFRMLIILHLNDVWFYSFEPKHTQSVNCTLNWLKTKNCTTLTHFSCLKNCLDSVDTCIGWCRKLMLVRNVQFILNRNKRKHENICTQIFILHVLSLNTLKWMEKKIHSFVQFIVLCNFSFYSAASRRVAKVKSQAVFFFWLKR